jgi:hypothetical protein
MMVLLSVAVLAVSAGVAASLTAPPAHAATPTQLTNLQFSWMGGLLRQTQVKYVTVRLSLVDPEGIRPSSIDWADGPLNCPCIVLQNTSYQRGDRSMPERAVTLRLTSGTSTDGVWSGRFAVGAADHGIWRPEGMAAGDIVGHSPVMPPPDDEVEAAVPAPWNNLAINVRGYDWPAAWLGTPVRSGSRFLVRGGVTLTRSLMPVVGMRLEIRTLCQANMSGTGAPNSIVGIRTAVRTNAGGRYAYTLSAARARERTLTCAAGAVYPTDTTNSLVVVSNTRTHG